MADSLRSKTIQCLGWNFTGIMAQFMVQFAVSIVLARLLAPEQFGLIGMLAIFTSVLPILVDSGFSAALIHKQAPTELQKCSVFYINIAMGIALYAVMYWSAPFISTFFDQPLLTPLTRFISVIFVISSFSFIQRNLLRKELRFRALTSAAFLGSALSGVIGIGLAYVNFGVWALAVQQVAAALFTTVFLWNLSTWRPSLIFNLGSLRPLFSYGSRILVSDLLDFVFIHVNTIIIAKFFPVSIVGYYTKARQLQQMPAQLITRIPGAVFFPVFASIQDDRPRMRRGVSQLLAGQVFIAFPVMAGLALVARPLVEVLLTEKWLPSVPYLQILCIVGALRPLHGTNLSILKATGHSDYFLRLSVVRKVGTLLGVAVGLPFGVLGLIWAQATVSALTYFTNCRYSKQLIGYSALQQLRDLFPYVLTTAFMAGVVYPVKWFPLPNLWALLLLQVALGGFAYLLANLIIRPNAFVNITKLGYKRFPIPVLARLLPNSLT